MYAQQTYTFTTAGATGQLGPTQPQINAAYASTNLNGSVTVSGGIQSFTIPVTGPYLIDVSGASGGGTISQIPNRTGGLGARMQGEFMLTAGDVMKILVGQQGASGAGAGAGGGGTYVTRNNILLIAAGAGGGSSNTTNGVNGVTVTAGTQDSPASTFGGTGGDGGFACNGHSAMYDAGGGGGYNSGASGNGQTPPAGGVGGLSFLNGGTGGSGNEIGGFGGGGGAKVTTVGGGGGGGYSGGAGGNLGTGACISGPQTAGGGGGSYNSGINQVNAAGVNNAPGIAIIKELCSISITAIGVNSNSAICSGATVTITTNAVSNYSWSTGATTSLIVVSPAVTTTYSLGAKSLAGCTAYNLLTVIVNTAVPTLTVTNTALAGGICPNSTVILTASGATTYTWTGGTVPVTNGIAFGPTIASTYVVTGANACGTTTAATSVSVHPFPTVNPVASTSTLCAGGTLTLTATGNATNYAWSGGSVPITNGAGFMPPASTITYSVIGTSALSCTALATVPVTVYATPAAAPVASPSLICIGGSSTLSAVGALTYTWASASQTVFTPNFTVTPSGPGVSTYTITKANSSCSDTKTISVTTNSLPTIFALALPNQVCALQPATLSVAGGQSYTWTAPGTPTYNFNGANPIVYPQASSLYTVAASDGTCINVTTVSLSVNPNPTVSISASSSSVCSGQSVTLSASGGNSYTWTTPSATSNGTTIVVSPTAATDYTLTGDNSSNCTANANQVILVYQSPTVGITVSKVLVCSGGPSTLTASGASSYTWDANTGNATTSLVVVNPTNTVSGPVTYTVTGLNSIGCPGNQTTQVNVYVPMITVTGNTSTCAGGQINLTASGTNASGFTWNTGSATFNGATLSTTVNAAGEFTVSANSNSNSVTCPATKTVAISIYANPNITAIAQRTTICKNEQVDLQAGGGVSYAWSNAMNGATITVSPQSNTTYTVTGTDANQCMGTGTVQVKVSACNGINEWSNAGPRLRVYPNPNHGEFIIEADKPVTLILVNELGQKLRCIYLTGDGNYKACIGDLPEGVYFLSGLTINHKIIVIR